MDFREWRVLQKHRIQNSITDQLTDEEFWKTPSENCPETRVEIAKRQSKKKVQDEKEDKSQKRGVKLFNKDGRPMNINQAKVDFTFKDDDSSQYILDVAVYKFLDSNLINVDLHPIYVTIDIKGTNIGNQKIMFV